MKRKMVVLAAAVLGITGMGLWMGGESAGVVYGESQVQAERGELGLDVLAYRARGYKGLDELLAKLKAEPENLKLREAIDQVAQQKDAAYSRLNWHTDLAEARKVAEAQNKPILYLRLLGKLTDEFSCANSRFFRTGLYSDPQVSAYLRSQYVLVWETERSVPIATIDFGDGRVIKRTLTGNSIHYVLTPSGKVVDALPGLQTPGEFLKVLKGVPWEGNAAELSRFHQSVGTIRDPRVTDVLPALAKPEAAYDRRATGKAAADAMVLTASKSSVERRPVAALSGEYGRQMDEAMKKVEWAKWEEIGKSYQMKLSANARELMKRQEDGSGKSQKQLDEMAVRFEKNVSSETARNAVYLRPAIHRWLLGDNAGSSVEELNKRVYAELFQTPKDDPWLGLVDEAAYTGLTYKSAH